MIMQFEGTGKLGVPMGWPATETKWTTSHLPLQKFGHNWNYLHLIARQASLQLQLPPSTVREVLWSILKWYPY